jgi:flagellar motor switch protein FliN/FliY
MSNIAQDPASSLIQHLAEAASSVLSQIAGVALQAQSASLDTPTEAATLVRIDISGALDGICELALSAPMTAQFAALLTGEPAEPPGEISNDTREAAVELIQQICGNAADRLRRAFGPLELKPRVADRDPVSGERRRIFLPRDGDGLELELHILRLAALVKPSAAAQPTPEPAAQAAEKTAVAATSAAAQSSNRNLDLLLDIELGVTLRFGSRQMLLKDILELCSGSVVELDRRVEAPVDLLIDGRLIARGEVVIVEGNYGLRILQVATQGEKIACLS